MNSGKNILITGAAGQLGVELTARLREQHGAEKVIATDIRNTDSVSKSGPFEELDVMDKQRMSKLIDKYDVGSIYHLAAILSAKGETHIALTWKLNMNGLLHVLDLAGEKKASASSRHIRIFWPSSIGVFGPDIPRERTPQNSPLNPTTVYGITKVAGEQWCAYYHRRFGVDVRSVRYPGLIGNKSEPGGGTTDYAVDMLRSAGNGKTFTCPLKSGTRLPMMYMEDAIKAALNLMSVPPGRISIRTSYNISAMSFSPEELLSAIRQHINGFDVRYEPDERDKIASSWPDSIDDTDARRDWDWKPACDLPGMVREMLKQ
ncbi:MAG: NAD-dependent epimerase/dehydratase family protein [Cyclonatronaceae bacterium]